MDTELRNVLLGILQRGVTEARSCALSGDSDRAAALLDALDNLPRHLANWQGSSEQAVSLQLKAFDEAYPDHSTNYESLIRKRISVL